MDHIGHMERGYAEFSPIPRGDAHLPQTQVHLDPRGPPRARVVRDFGDLRPGCAPWVARRRLSWGHAAARCHACHGLARHSGIRHRPGAERTIPSEQDRNKLRTYVRTYLRHGRSVHAIYVGRPGRKRKLNPLLDSGHWPDTL